MSPRWTAVVLAALTLLAAPVAAHGNYVSVDAQVTADGTVRLELAIVVTDGFAVIHTDDGGEPGAVVGHRAFEGYFHPDFEVELDAGYWANQSGTVSLWAVLHRDDGDGRFNPSDDPPLRTAVDDELVADEFMLQKASAGPVNVIAERDQAQETDRNEVTLRAVRLATDGYVVIRADVGGTPGPVVGQQALAAGEHRPVNVSIDEPFYERRPEEFALWAVVHRSDGNGEFNATADPTVRAGETPVMTRFFVKRTDPIEHTPTPVATETATVTATEAGHDAHEHTHTAATTTTEGHDEHEHTATATPDGRASEDSHDHDDHDHDTTETPGQAGFGLLVAVLSLVLAVLVGVRHRR